EEDHVGVAGQRLGQVRPDESGAARQENPGSLVRRHERPSVASSESTAGAPARTARRTTMPAIARPFRTAPRAAIHETGRSPERRARGAKRGSDGAAARGSASKTRRYSRATESIA